MSPSKQLRDRVWDCTSCYYKETCKDAKHGVACGNHAHVKFKPQQTSQHKP